MLAILRGPWGSAFKAYFWDKAQRLESDPIYAGLSQALADEMKKEK